MDHRIQTTIDAIQRTLSKKVEIATLAHERNMSVSRLRHMFKVDTGLSVGQYVKLARMQEAEHLLRTTYLSVKEVMFHVGFSNESHFSREFRRTHGLAPGQYRIKQQGNERLRNTRKGSDE